MIDFFKTDILSIIILIINIILFIMVIISNARIKKIKKDTAEFMRKVGDGKDIREDISRYMDRIIELETGVSELNVYTKRLDKRINSCVQKIGIVRYSAYKNSGNDLSFAIALLDDKDNGVVLNGIYSRDMSNIYAKPIIGGKSTYSMTEEENEALFKAVNDDRIKKV